VSKFGVQKTDLKNEDATQGFFYGNITTSSNSSKSLTLVVVDSEYFSHFYGNATSKSHRQNKNDMCKSMFRTIQEVAFDKDCKPEGTKDYLRRVPCPKGKLCEDEDTPSNVVPNYQFTYKIMDKQVPRYVTPVIMVYFTNCIHVRIVTVLSQTSWFSTRSSFFVNKNIYRILRVGRVSENYRSYWQNQY
jgi:hypothetical protein